VVRTIELYEESYESTVSGRQFEVGTKDMRRLCCAKVLVCKSTPATTDVFGSIVEDSGLLTLSAPCLPGPIDKREPGFDEDRPLLRPLRSHAEAAREDIGFIRIPQDDSQLCKAWRVNFFADFDPDSRLAVEGFSSAISCSFAS
jgi:hypothetical protein